MKKLLLLIAVVPAITATVTDAQPRKGDWMVGANIANGAAHLNSTVPHQFNFNITPNGGYFLSNRLIVGAGIGMGVAIFTSKNYAFSYGLSPFARYYFVSQSGLEHNKLYLFGELSTGVNGYSYIDKVANIRTSANSLNAGIGPGIGYMFTQNVGVEGLMKINKRFATSPTGTANGNFMPTLGIGFQIYLPGKKQRSEPQ